MGFEVFALGVTVTGHAIMCGGKEYTAHSIARMIRSCWYGCYGTYNQTRVVQLLDYGSSLHSARIGDLEPVVEYLDDSTAHAFSCDRASVSKRL